MTISCSVDCQLDSWIQRHIADNWPCGCLNKMNDYYTILLLGRIGMGKSTFGNALLGGKVPCDDTTAQQFQVGLSGNFKPTTLKCQVLSSKEKKITVVDTPGFGRHCAHHSIINDVYKENKELFDMIVTCQSSNNIRFNAIVYFFPFRGPPERSDGNFIQEISLISRFIGDVVFTKMILVCTNHSSLQYAQFDENMFQTCRDVFTEALKTTQAFRCLKHDEMYLEYLPLTYDADKIFNRITKYFPPNIAKIKLMLQDECSKCKGKLLYSEHDTTRNTYTHFYSHGHDQCDDLPVAYELSTCHPRIHTSNGYWYHTKEFARKVVYGYEKPPRQYCVSCKEDVGTTGCAKINSEVSVRTQINVLKRSQPHGFQHSEDLQHDKLQSKITNCNGIGESSTDGAIEQGEEEECGQMETTMITVKHDPILPNDGIYIK